MTKYRAAVPTDVPLILQFIQELAEYEKLSHEVVATEEDIRNVLFGDQPSASAILAFWDHKPAGFILYFTTVSTFLGKPGFYVEDLYIRPTFRGRGLGKGFLREVARRAVTAGYGRVEWSVLDWNEPSIKFYESLGAKPLKEWIKYQLSGEALKSLANSK